MIIWRIILWKLCGYIKNFIINLSALASVFWKLDNCKVDFILRISYMIFFLNLGAYIKYLIFNCSMFIALPFWMVWDENNCLTQILHGNFFVKKTRNHNHFPPNFRFLWMDFSRKKVQRGCKFMIQKKMGSKNQMKMTMNHLPIANLSTWICYFKKCGHCCKNLLSLF